jgi:hypothetical protein
VRRTAAVLVVLGTTAFATSASFAGSGRTVVHYFRPFRNGKIAPGIHVKQDARGFCWETSAVENRRYAWRCFRGNEILDPCFSPTRHAHAVLCPIKPWSEHVVRLRLTRSLPAWQRERFKVTLPVGLWTANGKRCLHGSGATVVFRSRPITYECAGGGVLADYPRRSTSTWTIWYARSYKARRLTRVRITDAWW